MDDLLDRVLDQIKKDVICGDLTAIAELLDKVPEKELRHFLPEDE